MLLDYESVRSADPDNFETMKDNKDRSQMTKSDAGDLRKIERLLELRLGLLEKEEYYVGKSTCTCGRILTFYDFVYTSLKDAGHSKSFVVHTLLGSKLILNKSRLVRCSSCDTTPTTMDYITPNYCCCRDDGITRVVDDIVARR